MARTVNRVAIMDSTTLATQAKELRLAARLTQRELADRLVKAGYATRLSVQAISQAENPNAEADMSKLRIAIVKELTGRDVEGPFWAFKDEVMG